MCPGSIQKFGKDGRVRSGLSRSEDGSVYHEWNDCKDREVVDELILAMAMDTSLNNESDCIMRRSNMKVFRGLCLRYMLEFIVVESR